MAREHLFRLVLAFGTACVTGLLLLWRTSIPGAGVQEAQVGCVDAVESLFSASSLQFEQRDPQLSSSLSLRLQRKRQWNSSLSGARPYLTSLTTPWGTDLLSHGDPPWQVYPRPQLVRDGWLNLNGLWNFAISPADATEPPAEWQGEIRVPFPLEANLSGVQRLLEPGEALWYHREFNLEELKAGSRVFLNFEAVDYRCTVYVNGHSAGHHTGGFTPFSLDIGDAVKVGANAVMVRVIDDTDSAHQLLGKQRRRPHGIWYTRMSGIWQTVWLEWIPITYVQDLRVRATSLDDAAGQLEVTPTVSKVAGAEMALTVSIKVFDAGAVVASASASIERPGPVPVSLRVLEPKPWTPDTPHLYGIHVRLLENSTGQEQLVDQVRSYAGLRIVGRARDERGHLRFTLNSKTLFHYGTLDQGFWPDGLQTPPSEEAMLFDIKFLKDAGFNMIRKHTKVEPRRYYYHCDRLGMLVWQDQVAGGIWPPKWTYLEPGAVDAVWANADHRQFMKELDRMISSLYNHPSIVVWVPFNERWGQHRTVEVGRWVMDRDPSRLVNVASGGNFWPIGHIADEHSYPLPKFPSDVDRFSHYVKVVGEFGGHGLRVEGHTFDAHGESWGYGGLDNRSSEGLRDKYKESVYRLAMLIELRGVAGGVYTQTTDVELEVNGLMTYDRRVVKISPADLREIHEPLQMDIR